MVQSDSKIEASTSPGERVLAAEDPAPCGRVPQIFRQLVAVEAELARRGISKDRENTQGPKFKFRGIDDVYGALSALLAENHIIVMPWAEDRSVTERKSSSGGTLFCVVQPFVFTFFSAIDGSSTRARMYGEAFDSGDKATNKSSSAAYKYAMLQAFCIPVEGNPEDREADFSTHNVQADKDARREADERQREPERRPAREQVGPETIEEALLRLLPAEKPRLKLRDKLLKARGVTCLDEIPDEDTQEVIAQIEQAVVAAKKAAAKKSAAKDSE